MRLSEIINAIRPATFAEKARATLAAVADGNDVAVPYPHSGWVNIADSQYTLGSPLAISAATKTQITVDGLGPTTNTTYADGMPASVWSDNRFKPSALGDAYNVRMTCTMAQATSGTGHYVTFDADIGTDETPFMASSQSIPLIKGQGVATLLTLSAPFFCLDTFGRNGARFYLTPSTDITAWGFAIFIQRTFTP